MKINLQHCNPAKLLDPADMGASLDVDGSCCPWMKEVRLFGCRHRAHGPPNISQTGSDLKGPINPKP